MKLLEGVRGDATLSPDGQFRYLLTRTWDARPPATWVMLNPSTADALQDDMTLRRVQSFSRAAGAGGVWVVNLLGLRASDPSELRRALDPNGPANDEVLDIALGSRHRIVVAAWGAHGAEWRDRVEFVEFLARHHERPLLRLGAPLAGGHPRHPCRAPDVLRLEPHA